MSGVARPLGADAALPSQALRDVVAVPTAVPGRVAGDQLLPICCVETSGKQARAFGRAALDTLLVVPEQVLSPLPEVRLYDGLVAAFVERALVWKLAPVELVGQEAVGRCQSKSA
jgi:hypothetical protein